MVYLSGEKKITALTNTSARHLHTSVCDAVCVRLGLANVKSSYAKRGHSSYVCRLSTYQQTCLLVEKVLDPPKKEIQL